MARVERPVVINDDGTGTVGTILDADFFNRLKDYLDSLDIPTETDDQATQSVDRGISLVGMFGEKGGRR